MIQTHGPEGSTQTTTTTTLSQPGRLFTSLLSIVDFNFVPTVRLMDEDEDADEDAERHELFVPYVREATHLRSLSGTLQMSYLVASVRF